MTGGIGQPGACRRGQSSARTVTTTIGFREAVFTEGGFYLNGGRYEIFGLNRHQAFAHALAHDQAQSDIRYAGLLAWAGFDYYSATGNG